VHALRAFVGAGADDAVIDQLRVDAVAHQQRIDAVSGHVVRPGQIELAAEGLGQASPDAIDDHHFTHDAPRCYWMANGVKINPVAPGVRPSVMRRIQVDAGRSPDAIRSFEIDTKVSRLKPRSKQPPL